MSTQSTKKSPKGGRQAVSKEDEQPLQLEKIHIKQGKGTGKRAPLIQLNEKELFKIAQTHATVETIASIMGCGKSTLYDRYSHIIDKAREGRKADLLTAMWEKALVEKDTKMMIWLSKQHLGYRDILPEEATQIHFNVYTNEIPK